MPHALSVSDHAWLAFMRTAHTAHSSLSSSSELHTCLPIIHWTCETNSIRSNSYTATPGELHTQAHTESLSC